MAKQTILLSYTNVYEDINRILLIMKIIIGLLLIATMSLSATTFSQTITLNVKDVTLKQVFDEIHQQSKFGVIYNDKHVDASKKVTIATNKMPLKTFLNKVLSQQNMTYRIKEKTIFVQPKAPEKIISTLHVNDNGRMQQKGLKGKVLGKESTPLQGVSIMIKGSQVGTQTNANGEFAFPLVVTGSVLVLSYTGYLSKEVVVGSETMLEIILEEDPESLEEVVVVAFGTQKKTDLVGSVTSIKPS